MLIKNCCLFTSSQMYNGGQKFPANLTLYRVFVLLAFSYIESSRHSTKKGIRYNVAGN